MPDESDNETLPPRKLARGESPLKGAAGRRLDAAKRNLAAGAAGTPVSAPVIPLPREVMFLLSIIPPAHTYTAATFSPSKLVDLLRSVDLGRAQIQQGGAGTFLSKVLDTTMTDVVAAAYAYSR